MRATRDRDRAGHRGSARQGHDLPPWSSVLVVVAHPDDESFGLGAVIGELARAGAAVHILCFTHGEASTLNENGSELRKAREAELLQASTELGTASVTLLGYADGELADVPVADLASHASDLADRHRSDGLLVFDDTGITGHPDHRAATRAAVAAAASAGLPVLAWTLPAKVAEELRAEGSQAFLGRTASQIDLRVAVDRAIQRRAALAHTSQISPTAVLWRRLELLGDHEHLRWLL